ARSGGTKGQAALPPRQGRMLQEAALPFLAERKIFDKVELQVRSQQDRQQCPPHEMEREHNRERASGASARARDQAVDHSVRRNATELARNVLGHVPPLPPHWMYRFQ